MKNWIELSLFGTKFFIITFKQSVIYWQNSFFVKVWGSTGEINIPLQMKTLTFGD